MRTESLRRAMRVRRTTRGTELTIKCDISDEGFFTINGVPMNGKDREPAESLGSMISVAAQMISRFWAEHVRDSQ